MVDSVDLGRYNTTFRSAVKKMFHNDEQVSCISTGQ